MKKPMPTWALVTSILVAVGFVAVLFAKAGSAGDASKDELTLLRSNQRKFSSGGQPPTAPATTSRGEMPPLAGPGAPPGGVDASAASGGR